MNHSFNQSNQSIINEERAEFFFYELFLLIFIHSSSVVLVHTCKVSSLKQFESNTKQRKASQKSQQVKLDTTHSKEIKMFSAQQKTMHLLQLILLLCNIITLTKAYSLNSNSNQNSNPTPNRRAFLSSTIATWCTATTAASTLPAIIISSPQPANAIGPVKISLTDPTYTAQICPPDRPIPGEKAMKGMKGVCVTVKAKLSESSPKDLEKVGVYGFVTDAITGDSVLANNPDLSTDAGQFAMIETITPSTKDVTFEFIAAVPMEKDLSKEENGIGPLDFSSLRLISFPGGQQFGGISPCEMNEFSAECEAWEEENGPYVKGKYMIKSNERTKGR